MPRASEFDEEDQAEEDEMNDQMRAVMRDDVEEGGRREKEEDDVAEEEEGDVNRKWGKVGKFDAVALKVCWLGKQKTGFGWCVWLKNSF